MIKMARMAGSDELNRIQNSLTGDTEAYAALVKEYQKMVHAVAFRMTGSLDDAEDLTQETFLRALPATRFVPRGIEILNVALPDCREFEFEPARAGKTAATTFMRSRRKMQFLKTIHATNFPTNFRAACEIALNKLPPKQRAAIVLTVFEYRSHAGAAKILKCTEATVSWRVFAARQKLKRLLKGISHGQI